MKKLLSFITLAVVSFSAFAGNGGGVNGPDLEGVAVPVSLDREIEIGKLEASIKTCKENFLLGLIEQAYGKLLKKSKYFNTKFEDASRFEDPTFQLFTSNNLGVMFNLRANSISLSHIKDGKNSGAILTPVTGTIKIPELKYEAILGDSSFDDWGNVISSKRIVRNIRLVNADQPILDLMNVTTKRDVAFKVDFRSYQNCLLKSVQ